MEGQPAKRQRVYSLEPNKIVQSEFTRKYVNYLVPALKKIKEKSSSSGDNSNCDDFKNVVKYEVDLALVFSAQGFAWSNSLKNKLQRDHDANVAISTTTGSKCIEIEEMKEGSIAGEDHNEDEEHIMKKQLRSLRRLIPGGEGMCDEDMVGELESYISCLQMQVNVLQCLVAEKS